MVENERTDQMTQISGLSYGGHSLAKYSGKARPMSEVYLNLANRREQDGDYASAAFWLNRSIEEEKKEREMVKGK